MAGDSKATAEDRIKSYLARFPILGSALSTLTSAPGFVALVEVGKPRDGSKLDYPLLAAVCVGVVVAIYATRVKSLSIAKKKRILSWVTGITLFLLLVYALLFSLFTDTGSTNLRYVKGFVYTENAKKLIELREANNKSFLDPDVPQNDHDLVQSSENDPNNVWTAFSIQFMQFLLYLNLSAVAAGVATVISLLLLLIPEARGPRPSAPQSSGPAVQDQGEGKPGPH